MRTQNFRIFDYVDIITIVWLTLQPFKTMNADLKQVCYKNNHTKKTNLNLEQ